MIAVFSRASGVLGMLVGILAATWIVAQAGSAAAAPASATPAASPVTIPGKTDVTYAPPKAADQKENQLVCKMEPVMGSHMMQRRCRSVADIKDRALQDRMQIEHAQQNIQLR
jgi:hypothetical protein